MHTEVEKETIVSFCWGHPLLGLHLSEICVGDNDNANAHSRRALLFYYFWQWHVFSCKPRQTLRRKKKIFFWWLHSNDNHQPTTDCANGISSTWDWISVSRSKLHKMAICRCIYPFTEIKKTYDTLTFYQYYCLQYVFISKAYLDILHFCSFLADITWPISEFIYHWQNLRNCIFFTKICTKSALFTKIGPKFSWKCKFCMYFHKQCKFHIYIF